MSERARGEREPARPVVGESGVRERAIVNFQVSWVRGRRRKRRRAGERGESGTNGASPAPRGRGVAERVRTRPERTVTRRASRPWLPASPCAQQAS